MTQKSKRNIEYTKATHAVERLIPSKNALLLCEQISDGKVSANAAVDAILRLHGLKQVDLNG